MKATRNEDGTYLVEPETDDEKEGLDYEYNRMGTTWLQETLKNHALQRKHQKDYERVVLVNNLLGPLSERDKIEIVELVKAEIEKRTPKDE